MLDMGGYKTIRLRYETWLKINMVKINKQFRSYDQVINYILARAGLDKIIPDKVLEKVVKNVEEEKGPREIDDMELFDALRSDGL